MHYCTVFRPRDLTMSNPFRSKVYAATESLRRFVWFFLGLCIALLVGLGVLDYRGADVTWAVMLAFVWIFGIVLSVERARQLTAPDSEFGVRAYVFNISVGMIWWCFVLFVTIRLTLRAVS